MNVLQIKWAKEDYHHDVNSPYCLRLASADASGTIIAWDVSQGRARAEFSDGNKPVQGKYSNVGLTMGFLNFKIGYW